MDVSALDSILNKLYSHFEKVHVCLQPDPPKVLYHYTNAKGLIGILETNRIHATHFRFVNDASEVTYGMTMLDALVDDRMKVASSEVVREFLSRTKRTANAFEGMFDCYVACFCEDGDLLHQWSAYAQSGGGFSLGFRVKEMFMIHPATRGLDQDYELRKVIYDKDQQRHLIAEVLDMTIRHLADTTEGMAVDEANGHIGRCCGFVRANIATYLMSFKDPAFVNEQEWRLCHAIVSSAKDHVRVRDGRYGLTPYVELRPTPMAGVNANKIPLHSIRHGPVHDPDNVKYALGQLLRTKGYGFVAVEGSSLPLRIPQ